VNELVCISTPGFLMLSVNLNAIDSALDGKAPLRIKVDEDLE
jgi:hypothetical protein